VLLCADWVIPVSGPPIADGAVMVRDGVIEAVGPAEELTLAHAGEEVRGFPGCALLPGLVNLHTHLDLAALRGFAPPSPFGPWMLRLLLTRRKLTAEDLAVSALWGAYECARSGVTTIADSSSEGWTVARAAGAAGLRARVYLEVFGLDDARLPVTMERLASGLERARRGEAAAERGHLIGDAVATATDGCAAIRVARGEPGGGYQVAGPPVEWGVSPHAPYTVSARLYREAARFARRAGLPLATHVAESPAEVELLMTGRGAIAVAYKAAHLWSGRRWRPPGLRPVRYVAEAGVLGPDTVVAHAVQSDAEDIATLAQSGAAVAHCPRSNMRLQCGAAPVAELLAAGVTVGLGTDGLCSNDDMDMFAEMRAALKTSRERAPVDAGAGGTRPPAPLSPESVLRMATLDGARALGLSQLVGSLDPGKSADIIAVQLPRAVPASASASGHTTECDPDPIEALVRHATAADVRMTMVGGVVLGQEGRVPIDVEEGYRSLRTRIGLAG